MKTLFKFLLSLTILLLSGYSHLYAHSSTHESSLQSVNTTVSTVLVEEFAQLEDHAIFTKSLSSGTEQVIDIEVTNIEEEVEEFLSSKKHSESTPLYTAELNALGLGVLFQGANNSLTFFKHFTDIASHRWYILFRVIRL